MQRMFGFHGIVHSARSLEKYVDAVVGYMAPEGVDTAVIEINNCFSFVTHPEVSDGDIDAAALRLACDRLRAAGVEPIPLYNCVGHQGWAERNSLLRAHPELDETPHIREGGFIPSGEHLRDENGLIQTTYTPGWCCAEPRVYDVVLPLLDELIEASGCKTMHLGMDEIYLFGECDRCRNSKHSDLFRDSLMTFYRHLREKGVSTMIWGDRLLNATKLLGAAGVERALYGKDFENVASSDCIDELPKDIILCDWHYGLEDKYPSAEELLSHGFVTWPSCWYMTASAEALWNASLDAATRLGRADLLPGMLVTCWSGGDDLTRLFTEKPEALDENQATIYQTIRAIGEKMRAYRAQTNA